MWEEKEEKREENLDLKKKRKETQAPAGQEQRAGQPSAGRAGSMMAREHSPLEVSSVAVIEMLFRKKRKKKKKVSIELFANCKVLQRLT